MDALLQHSALFEQNEWRDLADVAKRALRDADTVVQDYGLSLIERMPKMSTEHESDLVHLLIGVAKGTNAQQKERADKVLRKIQAAGLSPEATQTLHEYLSPEGPPGGATN
jgi:hypothetical protein